MSAAEANGIGDPSVPSMKEKETESQANEMANIRVKVGSINYI